MILKKKSYIIDRLDVLTKILHERNTDYTFHPDSIPSIWMREEVWTPEEIYARIYDTTKRVILHILMKVERHFMHNSTGKRRKSDFDTPYSLTTKFLDVETFDKSLTVCEPALWCDNLAISEEKMKMV